MGRAARISLWALAAIAAVPLLVAALVVAIGNTDPGRRMLERAIAQASSGQVLVEGLAGRFPDRLHVARIELRDREGTWGVASDLALDWSPSRLLRLQTHVAHIELAGLALHRLPLTEDEEPASERKGSTRLPLRIDIDALRIAALELAPAIAGVASKLEIRSEAHLVSASQFDLALDVERLDAPGRYEVKASADASRLAAHVDLGEPAGGLLAQLVGLPDLGALSVKASLDGPRNAQRLRFVMSAGPAQATAHGTIDLDGRALDLQVAANAPAMRPSADLAWQGARLHGYVKGPYASPDANVELSIRGVEAAEAGLRSLEAKLAGNAGAMALQASVEGLRVPGARPDLFAAAPLRLHANARLDDPARPVDFALKHPVLVAEGHANAGPSGTATITIQDLAPFAEAAGMELKGRTTVAVRLATKDDVTRVDVDGALALTGGSAPLPALLGTDAKLALSALLRAGEMKLERLQLDGRTAALSASGTRRGEAFDFKWKGAVSDLGALAPALKGSLSTEGRARGTPRELALEAGARGELGTRDFAPEAIEAHVTAKGLPAAPSGTVRARGRLLGSPLELAVELRHERDGTMRVAIDRADWKSAHAEGHVTLAGADRAPRGRIALRMTRLDDLEPLLGQPLRGSIAGNVELAPEGDHSSAIVRVEARTIGVPDAVVERLTLAGRINGLPGRPAVALQLALDDIAAQGVTGSARVDLNGPPAALAVNISSQLRQAQGYEATLSGVAKVNASAHTARVEALAVQYGGQHARLLQPAVFRFGDGFAVDRLRIGLEQAVLDVAGRVTPKLDLQASLLGVTPALLKPHVPQLDAVGTLAMQAKLSGTAASPQGTVRLDITGLRMRSGAARTLPAANLHAVADLDGRAAKLRARLDAGPRAELTLSGTAPLSASERINLRAAGTVDLALANPLIEADGRRAQGRVLIDVAATGLYSAPRVAGTVDIADADLQDVARGARLSNIAALLRLDGNMVQIARFTARAGRGTVTARGAIGVLEPDMPVDITIAARDARPLSSDLLTADMDIDLRVRGAARSRVDAVGRVHVKHADINIPGGLPPDVAVLDVRRPGEKEKKGAPPPEEPALVVGLDVEVDAPRAVFVRGRGLDAEMGGKIHVGGTAAAPQISGGFALRRGTFDLAGKTLKFVRGEVGFAGAGLQRRLDPTIDFAAETAAAGVTAKLGVTGFASAPKIALSSTPELPQDEVLARLLFGVSVKELSPLQLVQIARAVNTLRGGGGGGMNPLAKAQKRLGLDRLSVSGGDEQSGPSVEAGRYVSERVNVGVRQSTSGTTQARVQVDITRRLKIETTVGSGGGTLQGTTPENSPGTSVGLLYQREY
jgi:translocation and assembly module TamB